MSEGEQYQYALPTGMARYVNENFQTFKEGCFNRTSRPQKRGSSLKIGRFCQGHSQEKEVYLRSKQ